MIGHYFSIDTNLARDLAEALPRWANAGTGEIALDGVLYRVMLAINESGLTLTISGLNKVEIHNTDSIHRIEEQVREAALRIARACEDVDSYFKTIAEMEDN